MINCGIKLVIRMNIFRSKIITQIIDSNCYRGEINYGSRIQTNDWSAVKSQETEVEVMSVAYEFYYNFVCGYTPIEFNNRHYS